MSEQKWCDLTVLLDLIKNKTFPNLTPILCKPTKREPFMIFCCNHGLFADMSLTNGCTIFDLYELEDLLEWKYQIPNQSQISYLQGQDRIIIIKDIENHNCVVYMNGRKISYFDEAERAYVLVSAIAEDRNDKFISATISFDSAKITNIEDFMDSSFITEEEEIYLLNNNLELFYEMVNMRMGEGFDYED